MDKNDLNDHLQWVVGMAKTIETKISKGEELTSLDYMEMDTALDGMHEMLHKAHNIQYGDKG